MVRLKKLATTINTGLFSEYQLSQKALVRETSKDQPGLFKLSEEDIVKAVNAACKKFYDNGITHVSLTDGDRYSHIAIVNYRDYRRNEESDQIFSINSINGMYYISTGLYCGVVNLGDNLPQIEIRTGYSDVLFKRMLNYCCGIYADTNITEKSEENISIYSLLVQYLFLVSLRKVVAQSIPQKYVLKKDRGYTIRGNVDINQYINKDLLAFDKKISHCYSEQLEIQPIVDVLYTALKSCTILKAEALLPYLGQYEKCLKSMYSGTRPSKRIINSIDKDKCLNNSLYSKYKLPLKYAKILLNHNDLESGNVKSTSGVSGFLIDASLLWEMYLLNLMRIYLKNWDIESQCEISFYDNTFFGKNNYPDFVLRNRNTGKVYVFDAKFKRMEYDNGDIDNEDIRQLHAYSYYFVLKEGLNFAGAALLYPTRQSRQKRTNNIDNMYGIEGSNAKFGVFAVKDPSANETISENEAQFINELKAFIDD